MIGACWPAVAAALERSERRPIPGRLAISLQLAVTGASIAGFLVSGVLQDERPWISFRPLPPGVSVAQTDAFMRWLAEAKPRLGRVIAGDGVVALTPDIFGPSEWYKWNDEWSADRFAATDTLVFFRSERLRGVADSFSAGRTDVARLAGRNSNIVVLTNRPPAELPPQLVREP
jgi:hypothetical protein